MNTKTVWDNDPNKIIPASVIEKVVDCPTFLLYLHTCFQYEKLQARWWFSPRDEKMLDLLYETTDIFEIRDFICKTWLEHPYGTLFISHLIAKYICNRQNNGIRDFEQYIK